MSQGNRGMALEEMINYTNNIYRGKRLAVVHKRPTPVKIESVSKNGKVQGYLEAASTVDYEGVYRGKALVFEAKSTKDQHRFDLKNIHDHQIVHLRDCALQGAIAFLVIEFVKHDLRFFVPAKIVLDAWDKAQSGGAKSIQFDVFNYSCYVIPSTRGVPVDYLSIVDKLLEALEVKGEKQLDPRHQLLNTSL